MKFNGSTNIYVYGTENGNKDRLDACKKLVDLYLPECEKRKFTPIDAFMDVISTHHNFDDTKIILKRIIAESKVVGVDILVVSFQTIFRGDNIRTAYKTCYTCGGEITEHHIYDMESNDLLDELFVKLPIGAELRKALRIHGDSFGIAPMYNKKVSKHYKAVR